MVKKPCNSQDHDVRKGPWTLEEDLILINHITNHGEGVWNTLAKSAGLKRTGKSCRLRWLNYLRPDVRRGNITAEEQLLIMELHNKWGNKWSNIAKHLSGRTDNEIKNYWRTQIHKQLKQAENKDAQIHHNFSINDQPNLLSGCGPSDHAVDQASSSYPCISFIGNIDNDYVDTFHFSNDQSSDNDWSMDDLWSMNNLLNGD